MTQSRKRAWPGRASIGTLVLLLLGSACNRSGEHSLSVLSPEFSVDNYYASMRGPVQATYFDLTQQGAPELVWLTGFRSTVVNEDQDPLPQSFMCHTNLVYRGLPVHEALFQERSQIRRDKLFTISQGEVETRFPPGFGMPVIAGVAGQSFMVYNQLLNLNYGNFQQQQPRLRYENTVWFIPETERRGTMRPLYPALAQIMVAVNREHAIFNVPSPDPLQEQASCARGSTASFAFRDDHGQEFTYHWLVPPGREVRTTLITRSMLKLDQDTTIHYIAAHMHPYGESLALKDLTDGRVLFESHMTSLSDSIGVGHVEHYSSSEGIPVYKDHEYALISTYNNTSEDVQDAMAIMYLFLLDHSFELPEIQR